MDTVVTLFKENVYIIRIFKLVLHETFKLILHLEKLNIELKEDCTFHLIFDIWITSAENYLEVRFSE